MPTSRAGRLMVLEIEPDFSLVKFKKLVGGGTLKIVNHTVPRALKKLGYDEDEVKDILVYMDKSETVEGASHLKDEHLPVFDCADNPANGVRSISYLGHIKMCGAVQPFLSGAISKTINLPSSATAAEILDAYIEGWKNGMKSISIYRDGCKLVQPLSSKESVPQVAAVTPRRKPPWRRAEDPWEPWRSRSLKATHGACVSLPSSAPGYPRTRERVPYSLRSPRW